MVQLFKPKLQIERDNIMNRVSIKSGVNKIIKVLISLLITITISTSLIISTQAFGALTPSISSKDATEEFNHAIENIIIANKAKGATAALVLNGEVAMVKGYGYADEASDVKADGINTGFRIGSVSKTSVAVAALIAMQDGLINMNTDISQYLESDFPKLKYPVTMQHLLTHTGGFEENLTGMAVENYSDTQPLALSVRKYMPNQIYKSGEIASYSNYGIALAAYVIESVTGTDFAEYCMDRIFLPLKMTRTTFAHMHDVVQVSHAYLPDGKETMDLFMNLYPEGSMVSTAEDMSKYIKWLLSNDDFILRNENKLKLFDRQYAMADELGGIGYTWNRYQRNSTMYYSKKGETLHFYSRIIIIPEYEAGLFLSFNTYVPDEELV
jgi:CubicO group peptidase (beta-lactamase class C family)